MDIRDYVKIERSTVEDGNMSYKYGENDKVVEENRKNFWKKHGFAYDNGYIIRTDTKKLDTVRVVNDLPNEFTECDWVDALITDNPEVNLSLLTADCLSIVLFDIEHRVLSLIHAGFRWQDAGIIDKTLNILKEEYKSDPKALLVYLGDCISEEYYRWDENIFEYIHEESWIYKTLEKDDDKDRQYRINLREAAKQNLKARGLLDSNIVDSGIDCYSNQRYFSHVRALNKDEKEGRHITVVQMK